MLTLLLETIRDWVKSGLANFYGMYLGYITPEMFGAKGDGVTDDTTAVNNAISAAAAQGTYVKFLPKTYIVNNLSLISNETLIGDNTVLTTNENKTATLAPEWEHDIYITGITFDNFSQFNPKWFSRVTITNCKFINFTTQALWFMWVKNLTIKNCTFDNIGHDITNPSTYGKAIVVQGRTKGGETTKKTNNILIEGCEFSRIYGGKAIKGDNEVSNFRIVGNTFHDLTYGAIGFWNHSCDENSYNIISDNKIYNMGTFEVAPNDTVGQTSAQGATAIYVTATTSLVDGERIVDNHHNVIVTRNTLQNLAENAIEGHIKEISFNVIDTTGVIVGREKGKGVGGIYVSAQTHNVHDNVVRNCLNGGRGIYAHHEEDSVLTFDDLKICNNVISNCGDNTIRVQGFVNNLTIRDNAVDGMIEIVPDSTSLSIKKINYRQPEMFESWKSIRYDEGWIDIEGDYTKKDGWKVTGNVTTNADGNMVIPPSASISQTFERNTVNRKANARVYCVVAVTYSLHDIIGTSDYVMRMNITQDTGSVGRSKYELKGIYSETPEEKEFFTRYYVLNTNAVTDTITFKLSNINPSAGNLEIKNIQVKMVKGINPISSKLLPPSATEGATIAADTAITTELQTKAADTTVNYFTKIKDSISGENYYLGVANGKIIGIPESQLQP